MNSINIKIIRSTDSKAWDAYVFAHSRATLYHLSGWKNVIEKTYGHKTYYLIATQNSQQESTNNPINPINPNNPNNSTNPIIGILPLVHLKHFLFGNSLISIPFFDLGGILANDVETEKVLLQEALKLGRQLKVKNIEFRHIEPLSCLADSSKLADNSKKDTPMSHELSAICCLTKSHKVRMLLDRVRRGVPCPKQANLQLPVIDRQTNYLPK